MAYTKTVWETGDTITAEKLNNMEGGIEDAQFPELSTADVGKPLGVVPVATEPKTILAPEQTVEFVSGVGTHMENCVNLDEFVSGAIIELIVDNVSYIGTVQTWDESEQLSIETPDGGFYGLSKVRVDLSEYTLDFSGPETGEYVVSVLKPTVIPSIGVLSY